MFQLFQAFCARCMTGRYVRAKTIGGAVNKATAMCHCSRYKKDEDE